MESADVEDECLEEFQKLKLHLLGEETSLQVNSVVVTRDNAQAEDALIPESASSLADTFTHLHLTAA